MSNGQDSEETTILATYTTRRDAELARDYLDDAGIRAFVRADDAGGMHPQLQRPHGVKLVGMSGTAQRARDILGEAGLLPQESPSGKQEIPSEEEADGLTFSLRGMAGLLGAVALVLILLLFALG